MYILSAASSAMPLRLPEYPARVVVTPAGVTKRIRSLVHTARSPFARRAIACGRLNVANVPVPSFEPAAPEPASVETTRAREITRMRWFHSETATLPSASSATPMGWSKSDDKVETTPRGVTTRTRLLLVSATRKSPFPSMARPLGYRKRASAPTPSAKPPLPPGLPAKVATYQ